MPTRARHSLPPEHPLVLADIKALLVQCREAELLVVSSWLSEALRSDGRLRLVKNPSSYQPSPSTSTFIELAGRLRREIHELRMAELLVLHAWVRDRLAGFGS